MQLWSKGLRRLFSSLASLSMATWNTFAPSMNDELRVHVSTKFIVTAILLLTNN